MASEPGRGTRPALPRRTRVFSGRQLQIRTAALELFAARGYRVTTIDEIGERVGIKGPSVYKHFRSKQDLLVEIMVETMDVLIAAQRAAIRSATDVREQLRRAVEAHVRYHAEHTREAFVGNREISSLEEPHRSDVLRKRAEYDRRLRRLIEKGVREGVFDVASPRLVSYGILDMGLGVSVWYRSSGSVSADELVGFYADLALRMVACRGVPHRRGSAPLRPPPGRRVPRP
jgi:AcrR family transcriptional regulator